MENLEYSGLMYPDFSLSTKSGEVYFTMKKKDEWGPAYYVFEQNLELLSEEEKNEFKETWKFMKALAGLSGICLYDSAEIKDAVQAQIMKVL